MRGKAAQLKRIMQHLQDALTASALAEEGVSDAAGAVRAERSAPGPAALRTAPAQRPLRIVSAPPARQAGR
jgi:hypothetical protein